MAKILFVMTGADYWTLEDGTKHPTGFWAEEAVVPAQEFKSAGYDVVVATPGGVEPTVDQGSLSPDVTGGEDGAEKIKRALDEFTELTSPVELEHVKLDEYAAVFIPGGHGPMEDLASDADTGKIVGDVLRSGKPLGVVCHGPAALLAATGSDGKNPFEGYKITAFTNVEEQQAGLADKAKWLLQDRLQRIGVDFQEGEAWAPNIVIDRNVFTGQNPASSAPLAQEIVKALQNSR